MSVRQNNDVDVGCTRDVRSHVLSAHAISLCAILLFRARFPTPEVKVPDLIAHFAHVLITNSVGFLLLRHLIKGRLELVLFHIGELV